MSSTLRTTKTREESLILLIQAAIGLTWLRSGVEKVTDPHFLAAMAQTLGLFASHNPNGWYRGFLISFAIPHASAFGSVVEVGETLAGVALVASAAVAFVTAVPWRTAAAQSVALSAIVAGTLMSLNYWFAAAWLTPADDTVNLLMAVMQVLVGIAITLRVRGGPQAEWTRAHEASTSKSGATS